MQFLKDLRAQTELGSTYYTACGIAAIVATLMVVAGACYAAVKEAFPVIPIILFPGFFTAYAARSCFLVARRKKNENA